MTITAKRRWHWCEAYDSGGTDDPVAEIGSENARFRRTRLRARYCKGGPFGWDALTYLCFSRDLRLDVLRSDAFVRTARVLLDAGTNANTG
jgi:hypothetical protein